MNKSLVGALILLSFTSPAAPVPFEFSLFFTGNTRGRIEHCLCDGKEMGGFAERSTIIQKIRQEDSTVYFLDAGDLVDSPDYSILAGALSLLKKDEYAFVALGEKDLQLSRNDIGKLRAEIGLPFLLTNGSSPGTVPVILDLIRGTRIAFFNLVDRFQVPVDWFLENEEDALERNLSLLPADIPFVVVIAHLDDWRITQLVEKFKNRVNVFLDMHSGFYSPLRIDDDTIRTGADPCEQITHLYVNFTAPQPYFLYERMPTRKGEKVSAKALPDIAKIKKKGKPGGPSTPLRVGNALCIRCHSSEHLQWKTSPHGKAFEGKDEKCKPCHSPMDEAGDITVGCESCHGPGAEHILSAYSFQVKRLEKIPEYGKITEAICLPCHKTDGKHILRFDFKTALTPVIHGKPAPSGTEGKEEEVPPSES